MPKIEVFATNIKILLPRLSWLLSILAARSPWDEIADRQTDNAAFLIFPASLFSPHNTQKVWYGMRKTIERKNMWAHSECSRNMRRWKEKQLKVNLLFCLIFQQQQQHQKQRQQQQQQQWSTLPPPPPPSVNFAATHQDQQMLHNWRQQQQQQQQQQQYRPSGGTLGRAPGNSNNNPNSSSYPVYHTCERPHNAGKKKVTIVEDNNTESSV